MKKFILGSWLLPLLTFAQVPLIQPGYGYNIRGGSAVYGRTGAPIRDITDVLRLVDKFIGWVQAALFILAVVMALYAAYLFISGKGENLSQARDVLIYAAVGVGVALIAYAIVPLVCSFLNVACPF